MHCCIMVRVPGCMLQSIQHNKQNIQVIIHPPIYSYSHVWATCAQYGGTLCIDQKDNLHRCIVSFMSLSLLFCILVHLPCQFGGVGGNEYIGSMNINNVWKSQPHYRTDSHNLASGRSQFDMLTVREKVLGFAFAEPSDDCSYNSTTCTTLRE
jgi:hypothetical protein